MLLKKHYIQRTADLECENDILMDRLSFLGKDYLKRGTRLAETKTELSKKDYAINVYGIGFIGMSIALFVSLIV